jgi:hypothetical protein
MSTVTNPLSGLIEGLLQGHQLAQQLHQQQQNDQAFKTNQALHEQQMSVQDIMNEQAMQKVARRVDQNGMVLDSGTPAAPSTPSPLSGVAGMPQMPNDPGLGASGSFMRKAKGATTVTNSRGEKTQWEPKSEQEQQQSKLNETIQGNSALEKASVKAKGEAEDAELDRRRTLMGQPIPADLAGTFTAAQYPHGLLQSEIANARAGITAAQEHTAKLAGDTATARKTGLEADELQRQLDMKKGSKPSDYLDLVDQVVPLGVKGNASLNLRTKAVVAAALHRGDMKGAEEAIKEAGAEMGRVEVATNPLVAQNKVNISLQTQDAKTAAMGLTEDDYRREGEKYAITGVMPPMGMGSNGRGKIMHYAQEFSRQSGLSPRDLAVAQASFSGDKASLGKFQAQRDQIVSFEQTAQKNLDQFIGLAGKIVDTGSPWLNLPMRSLSEKLVGSTAMAAVNAARTVANNEIAKVTSGGGLGGVLSDSARHEVEAYNPKDATLAQTLAVAKVLKTDMANRHQSMDATLGEIRGRIGTSGQTAPAAAAAAPQAGTIRVKRKSDGVAGSIDAKDFDAAKYDKVQ